MMFYYADENRLVDIKEVIANERRLFDCLKNEVSVLKSSDRNELNNPLYNRVQKLINDEIALMNNKSNVWDSFFDIHKDLINQIDSYLNQLDQSQHLYSDNFE